MDAGIDDDVEEHDEYPAYMAQHGGGDRQQPRNNELYGFGGVDGGNGIGVGLGQGERHSCSWGR